jgi:hypothetical protein
MQLLSLLIKRLILTLLVIPLIALPIAYFTLQTHQGAKWISHWLSNDNNNYQISIQQIRHSFTSPLRVDLKGLLVKRKGQEIINVADAFAIFNGNPLSNPNWLWHLQLENGRIIVKYPSLNGIQLRSDWLLIKNVELDITTPNNHIILRRVSAGIRPWTPNDTTVDSSFRLSASTFSVNEHNCRNLLILGGMKKGNLIIESFGADLPNGDITGQIIQYRNNKVWQVNNLYLNHFRWQSEQSPLELFNKINIFSGLDIRQLNIIGASFEGPDWALNDASLSLQNIRWRKGQWSAQNNSKINFNAESIVYGDLYLNDPIVKLGVTGHDIDIQQLNARWQGGLLKAEGQWRNDELTLNNVILSAVEYTLPSNWRSLIDYPFPDWLKSFKINNLKSGRNVIIDTNPQFPFQLTLLDIDGQNLTLLKDRRFSLWDGKLNIHADNATFNKIDIRYPRLEINGEQTDIAAEFSTFIDRGIMEGKLAADKSHRGGFTLDLTGQNVPLHALNAWHWQPTLPDREGSFYLTMSGLNSDTTVNGKLQATDEQGEKIEQTLAPKEADTVRQETENLSASLQPASALFKSAETSAEQPGLHTAP